jgi:hypothetical protein
MPHDTMRTARLDRNRAPWLEPLESRDVPSGFGNLFSSSHLLQPLVLGSPVTVLQSLQDSAPTTEVQPVRAVGLDGTFADLLGKSVPLDAVSLVTALPAAGSVQELLGLGSEPDMAARTAAVLVEVQPLIGTAEQTLLSFAANVAAVPATQGSALPAVSVPIEVQPLIGTAKQTLLPFAANVTAVVTSAQEQAGASAAESSAVPAAVPTQLVGVGNPGQQTTTPAAGIVAFDGGNTRTTRTADSAFFSEVPAPSFFQSEGAAFSDQVAVTTTAASAPSTSVDRGTALDAGGTGGEGTVEVETAEPVMSLPDVEGSGLLDAILPASDNGTDEGWESMESLSGNVLFLWIFGLPASVVALVAVEMVRRRKQDEQPRYHLTPGWGAADVS